MWGWNHKFPEKFYPKYFIVISVNGDDHAEFFSMFREFPFLKTNFFSRFKVLSFSFKVVW